MKAMIYDALQLSGLLIMTSGVWNLCGGAWAAIIGGAALLVVPMLELHLARRAG